MVWREKGRDATQALEKNSLYKKRLSGIEIYINSQVYDIDLVANFSIKKRKVISPSSVKESYKIIIENIAENISYLCINSPLLNTNYYYISPAIKSSGILFSKSKKIYIDKKKNKAEFTIDSKGKIA